MSKKKFVLPVSWEMAGVVEVEAGSLEEAIIYFNEHSDDIPLPKGEYVDSSFTMTEMDAEDIAELYNNDADRIELDTATMTVEGKYQFCLDNNPLLRRHMSAGGKRGELAQDVVIRCGLFERFHHDPEFTAVFHVIFDSWYDEQRYAPVKWDDDGEARQG